MRPDNIVEDGAPGGRDGNVASGAAAPKKSPRVKNAKPAAATAPKTDSAVGNVLRSVYQKAVDEAIPAEMLDLLSKLD
jgi:hypothetical protein